MPSITTALAVMTELDVRRRGDSLRCPHLAAIKPGTRTMSVMCWERDQRLPVTGHPSYEPGLLCSGCHAVYRARLGG
jgi:hypothetical protein